MARKRDTKELRTVHSWEEVDRMRVGETVRLGSELRFRMVEEPERKPRKRAAAKSAPQA